MTLATLKIKLRRLYGEYTVALHQWSLLLVSLIKIKFVIVNEPISVHQWKFIFNSDFLYFYLMLFSMISPSTPLWLYFLRLLLVVPISLIFMT